MDCYMDGGYTDGKKCSFDEWFASLEPGSTLVLWSAGRDDPAPHSMYCVILEVWPEQIRLLNCDEGYSVGLIHRDVLVAANIRHELWALPPA